MITLLKDLWRFFCERKKWWLLPVVVAMLIIGLMIIFSGTAISPFVYTVF